MMQLVKRLVSGNSLEGFIPLCISLLHFNLEHYRKAQMSRILHMFFLFWGCLSVGL